MGLGQEKAPKSLVLPNLYGGEELCSFTQPCIMKLQLVSYTKATMPILACVFHRVKEIQFIYLYKLVSAGGKQK